MNVRKGVMMYEVLNAKMTVLNMFKGSIKNVCPIFINCLDILHIMPVVSIFT